MHRFWSGLIAGVLAAVCLIGAGERVARAQPSSAEPFVHGETVSKLGILAISDADSVDVMMEMLRTLGWVDGKTMEVVYPKATQDLGELPLITVDGFQLDINLATAQSLGVSVPPAVLQRAVRVIR